MDRGQLVLTYLGSAGCGWCNREGFPAVIRAIKDEFEVRAKDAAVDLVTRGAALDWSIEAQPGEGT